MRRKILALLSIIVLVVGVSAAAVASSQVNTVITASAITVAPGDTVNLTANTTTTGNHWFNDDEWSATGGVLSDIVPASGDNTDSFVSTAKLTSNVEGAFTVTYWIEVRTGSNENSQTREDDDDIVITFVEVQQPVIFECPAAPAIAARLLRDNGVAGKDRGDWVSMVAHEMGSQQEDENGSWFHGNDKCIEVEGVDTANPAYEAAVNQFLIEQGAYTP